MKRSLLALALALALLQPTAQARDPDPYPEVITRLLPAFIEESEARGKASEGQPWYPLAASYLQKAKDAQAAGRFRLVLFDLETYEELVLAHRLNDSVASLGSEGERKSRIVGATQEHMEATESKWADYRAKLHRFDGKVQSLQTVENLLYATDIALTAIVGTTGYPELAREFPKQPTTDLGYVQALVRSSYVPGLSIDWASRMLDEVVGSASEGLPPLADPTNLTGLVREALLADFSSGNYPPAIQIYETRLQPARQNREGFLALAGIFAEKRADRLSQMQTQFGDARARRDVVRDADGFMDKALNNTTLERAQGYGLTGVFSADAIDRALYAHELIAAGLGDLTTVLVAWSAIDGAHYAEDILAKISTVEPSPTPTEKRTPFLAPALLTVALLAAIALAAGRRAR